MISVHTEDVCDDKGWKTQKDQIHEHLRAPNRSHGVVTTSASDSHEKNIKHSNRLDWVFETEAPNCYYKQI